MSQPDLGRALWAPAPLPSSSPGDRAAGRGYKVLVTAFLLVHISAILWWNVPSKDYDSGPREAPLPARLRIAERELFAWKSRVDSTSRIAWALSTYTLWSGTWQSWLFFAPDPLAFHNYLTVSAVLSEDAQGQPIYDPVPIYTSYRGTPREVLARFASGAGALDPHSFDEALAISLTSEDFAPEIEPFARYWADVYTRRTGRRPLGVDVIANEVAVPPAFSGISSRDVELRPWRAGWFRY